MLTKRLHKKICSIFIIIILVIFSGIQNADSLEIPYTADFTLRDYCLPCGTADAVDDTDDGFGFYKYITGWSGITGEHFIEFYIGGSGTVSQAYLDFSISNISEHDIYGTSKDFSIACYSGIGATDVSAFNSGTLLSSLTASDLGVENYLIDITSVYNSFVSSGDDYLGIRFFGPVWTHDTSVGDQIIFNDGNLEVSGVPEPATIFILGFGLLGFGALKKKLRKN